MMISSTVGLPAGIVFVGVACCNVVLMFEAQRTQNVGLRNRLVLLHRVGGYAFIVFYCMMASAMSERLAGDGLSNTLPTHILIHVVLVLSLVPLLLLKVSIARRYKQAHFMLMPLGLAIFIMSAVLVAIPAFSELLRSTDPEGGRFEVTAVLVIALSVLLGGWAVRSAIQRSIRSSISTRPLSTTKKPLPSVQENVPMTLRLVGIVPQTDDTTTFHFLLPRERPPHAKPGQFLTFHWIIDGQRVVRSYTISSSPVRMDHVEITSKHVANGRVSGFLHDRAKTGLTVEATGPYGHFYFDETVHRSIVLIAAGAGITPMISILRYIGDRGLSTPAMLLYCVRTRKDIIFATELERLRNCVPSFTYSVNLSQPDDLWKGPKGHLTREFILEHVTDLQSPTFFLCGPRGFMDSARRVLTSLGVNASRITQESFGERATGGNRQVVATVEFMRSNTVCAFPAGPSLLDVAERNGVVIPFGCRQGQCGTCATRVLSGAVHMETDAGLTADQKSTGWVLPCVSRAAGNVVVEA
jgi:ferredoxin-NADP reductase